MKRHLTYQEMHARLWTDACRFDGIDPSSTAVVFSEYNPFTPQLNALRPGQSYLVIESASAR